jgi:hypothetical protein
MFCKVSTTTTTAAAAATKTKTKQQQRQKQQCLFFTSWSRTSAGRNLPFLWNPKFHDCVDNNQSLVPALTFKRRNVICFI